jgi:hypothetical protein
MAEIIESLRTNFSEIVGVYSELIDKRDTVAEKVAGLKERYNDLVKQNAQPMFLFCLESLFFQYKILNLEMENYQKSASLIQNRIYGDYYKLYNMMTNQCKDNNIDISNSSISTDVALPLYKDIDPFFKYRIEDVVTIHDKILEIVGIMDDLSTKKTENIRHHRENVDVGFLADFLTNVGIRKHFDQGANTFVCGLYPILSFVAENLLGKVGEKDCRFHDGIGGIYTDTEPNDGVGTSAESSQECVSA